MGIKVSVCHAANGDVGLLEFENPAGKDLRRVFQILDSGHVVWRYVDAFMLLGNGARSYGTPFDGKDFEIRMNDWTCIEV